MSAERLREAAALMRSRAEAATPSCWYARPADAVFNPSVTTVNDPDEPLDAHEWIAECGPYDARGIADAAHIASWHPAVALAVADWLDAQANDYDFLGIQDEQDLAALRVADAYLGSGQ